MTSAAQPRDLGNDPIPQRGQRIALGLEDAAPIGEPRLVQLFDLWKAAWGANDMPAKDFINPEQLRFILGSMVIFETHWDPLRFRYRLFGTDIADRVGIDLTGAWLKDHPDKNRSRVIHDVNAQVVTLRKPAWMTAEIFLEDRWWPWESLCVPTMGPTGQVDFVLAAQLFHPDSPRWRRSQS